MQSASKEEIGTLSEEPKSRTRTIDAAARKAAAKKVAAKKAAAKQASAKTATRKKAPARKTAAKKAGSARTPRKKAAAGKATAKKATAKKATAKKAATRKAAASKTRARKTRARKTTRKTSEKLAQTAEAPEVAPMEELFESPPLEEPVLEAPALPADLDLDAELDLEFDLELDAEPDLEPAPEPAPPSPPLDPASQVDAAALRLGIENLYPEQREIIRELLSGRDALMVLPTGFGKSACYQVPSLVLPKPVLLISPLLALLSDQHEKLRSRDIPCVRIDGTVRGRARREALARIAEGGSLLVMTTPETADSEELAEAVAKSGLSLAAVDEAHCISEWGHDFRPAYVRLGRRLRELGSPAVLALTATATERVREGIVSSLHLRDPAVVATSPHRSNLAFEVVPCEGDLRPRALLRLVRRLRRPGIIYCATTSEVDQIYALLRRFKIPSHRYHGKMTATERTAEQERYMRPRRRSVMVATSAFGLGIDKPDIRYILHYQSPASLEQYVQEAGRAGRDGRRANCILLWDSVDRRIHEALQARSRIRPDQLYRIGHALSAWAGEERTPTLGALALSAEMGPRIAAALVAKIEEAGLVARVKSDIQILAPSATIDADTRRLAGQFDTLRTQDGRRLDDVARYAMAGEGSCRAVFLRRYFGEEEGEACGLCDACGARPPRPEHFFEPLVAPKPERKKKPSRRRSRRGRRSNSRQRRPGADPASEPGGAQAHSAHRRGHGSGAGPERTRDGESGGPPRRRRRGSRRGGSRSRRGGRGGRRRNRENRDKPPTSPRPSATS